MNEICKLIRQADVRNEYGDLIKEDCEMFEVFCQLQSIRQSEFYQANAVGMKPEIVLELRQEDYNGQEKIEFDCVMYRVIRTYLVGKSNIELILTRWVYGDS